MKDPGFSVTFYVKKMALRFGAFLLSIRMKEMARSLKHLNVIT